MKYLILPLLLAFTFAAKAQQIGGDLRLMPVRNDGLTWQQASFYAGSFLTPRTLLRLEFGWGLLTSHFDYISNGQMYTERYTSSTPTFGVGVDQTMITLKAQRITLNLGISVSLPQQIHTRIDLTKYRLFDSNLGLRLGYGAGYARRFDDISGKNEWGQIGYINLGAFYQII